MHCSGRTIEKTHVFHHVALVPSLLPEKRRKKTTDGTGGAPSTSHRQKAFPFILALIHSLFALRWRQPTSPTGAKENRLNFFYLIWFFRFDFFRGHHHLLPRESIETSRSWLLDGFRLSTNVWKTRAWRYDGDREMARARINTRVLGYDTRSLREKPIKRYHEWWQQRGREKKIRDESIREKSLFLYICVRLDLIKNGVCLIFIYFIFFASISASNRSFRCVTRDDVTRIWNQKCRRSIQGLGWEFFANQFLGQKRFHFLTDRRNHQCSKDRREVETSCLLPGN